MHGATIGDVNFSDLDYADDIALLTELMELLQSTLEVFAAEAAPIGLVVNWKKTKIQSLSDFLPPTDDLDIGGEQVKAITSFTYLGTTTHSSYWSGQEISRRLILPGPLLETWITSGGQDWHFTTKSYLVI